LKPSESSMAPAGRHLGGSVATSSRRVLIVDDDSVVLRALEELVRTWGHVPIAFGTFEQARASLETSAPDVLVVDVRLGLFNGLQLLHLAKQAHPDLSMLVVSGYDDPVLRSEASRLDAEYLLKPVDSGKLHRLLGFVE
jgi:DNA-binding NtrC family response regulator